MTYTADLINRLFSLKGNSDFDGLSLEVFRFQYENNRVYQQFCKALDCSPGTVDRVEDIPFMPVSLFKTRRVVSFEGEPDIVFKSSGTTGSERSAHAVADLSVYEQSLFTCFHQFYGHPSGYCILALLPGYLERSDSSLVYMTRRLIEESGHPHSGFYLHEMQTLSETLQHLMEGGEKIFLLGVSHALLDLAEQYPGALKNAIVMETGGMKGRRREIVREELHKWLSNAFSQEDIHSEYGMTELLSQAYSKGGGLFECPPWMRILVRDTNDPLTVNESRRAGGINVIDLANIYSCSFIATEDIGRKLPDGRFEVIGRLDNSDVRGCNLMVVE
ncbi:MAG: acyltransferase [Bacteroidales bacterium]